MLEVVGPTGWPPAKVMTRAIAPDLLGVELQAGPQQIARDVVEIALERDQRLLRQTEIVERGKRGVPVVVEAEVDAVVEEGEALQHLRGEVAFRPHVELHRARR